MTPCSIHKFHAPRPLTVEAHHIVPQAWQHSDGTVRLWAPKVVYLCPTGHRNVHDCIVRMMKWMEASKQYSPIVAYRALKFRSREAKIALDGLQQWIASGRTIEYLLSVKQYGQA